MDQNRNDNIRDTWINNYAKRTSNIWAFVEEYFPDFYSSPTIASFNEIEKEIEALPSISDRRANLKSVRDLLMVVIMDEACREFHKRKEK